MSTNTIDEDDVRQEQPVSRPILSVVGVAKTFGGAAALKGVSVDFRPGEIHALMGMNGAGKSTLVQVISGAITPDGGHVEIAGDQVHLNPRRARALGVATVPQRREIVPGLTVAENVVLGVVPHRAWVVDWRRMRRQAAETLADLGIELDVNRICGELTVAEQTLVEVAREVSRGGRVLILDEPTACLGVEAAEQVHGVVRRLRDSGVAVVYISHHIDEVIDLADRITVLREGEIVASATGRELDAEKLVRAMVGRDVVSKRSQRPPASEQVGISVRSLSNGRFISQFQVDVRRGETVAVLGPAGDAQSQLFDILTGRVRPEEGALEVDGHHVPLGRIGASLRSGLRCITGDRRRLGLVLGLSVDENMLLAHDRLNRRRLHRTKDLAQRGHPLRERFRVKALTQNPPVVDLSGGNQQKVLLAKWLHTDPVACFLEDPTNGVDISAMAEIHQHIDDLVKQGAAVLLASSSAEEVMRLADRVVVVRGGRIVARRDITDITRDELVALTLGGTPS